MGAFSLPTLGLDISDESVKFVKLKYKSRRRELDYYGEGMITAGVVDSGTINDRAALTEAIKEALPRSARRGTYAVLSLPEEKGFLRLIKMQKVPMREVRQTLEYQLEEHIPFPPQELFFDYKVFGTSGEKGEFLDIVVIAYPRALVFGYMEVVRATGLTPFVFELESQAVARAVVPERVEGAVLVGDIGKTRTTFSIAHEGVVRFTATIKLGGKDMDAILARELHIDAAEAAKVKIGRGIDYSSQELVSTLTPVLATLKDEIMRQVSYWDRTQEGVEKPIKISNIYLCGGDAHLKGLPEFLTLELGLNVVRARVWERVFDVSKYIPDMTAHDTLFYTTAFGLTLRAEEEEKP